MGGEERAVAEIAALLASRGHAVELLERASSDTGRLQAGASILKGGLDPREVALAVRRLGADVVHAHNLHPLLGWRALAAARAAGACTVLHIHNFRLFCAIGVAYRDGAPCYRCRGRNTMAGLRFRCRGSIAEAAAYAGGLYRQQPQLFEQSDRFVVLSQAHGARLRELGLPSEKTSLLPNFVPNSGFANRSAAATGGYALVSGRLVEEKGYDTAIAASRLARVPLVIAGAGPDEPRLRQLATGADIRFRGFLSPGELAEVRRNAAIVLVPSHCEESLPYAVLDAFAAGVPVLGSDRGGVAELVGADAALNPDDPEAWAAELRELWQNPRRRAALGTQALERTRNLLGEDRYHDDLMRVYAAAQAGQS
jgi:glycosyltransferase involved in cell wall biosynthesis